MESCRCCNCSKLALFEREFTRHSPEQYAQHTSEKSGGVVFSHRLIEDRSRRRALHGKFIKITSQYGSIYRVASFNAHLKGKVNSSDPAEIVIDWAGWLELYGLKDNVDPPLRLTVRKIKWHEIVAVYFKHADPFYRLSSWFSLLFTIIGLALGYFLSKLP